MTESQDGEPGTEVDGLADWLDGDEAAPATTPQPTPATADTLFLHGLLERLHDRKGSDASARTDRALRRIDARLTNRFVVDRPRAPLPSIKILAVAAGIAGIAIFIGVLLSMGSPTAMAAVHLALREATAAIDREYAVSLTKGDAPPVEATLYVRGGTHFVLRYPSPLGGDRWLGSDGDAVWFVPAAAILPVVVAHRPQFLNRWMEERGIDMPFLQITTVLHHLERDYGLELLPDEPLGAGEPPLRRVRGQRLAEGTLPQQIDLWAEPKSGVVHRLRLEWGGDASRTLQFDLKGAPDLADGWYDHQAHHGPGRAVVQN